MLVEEINHLDAQPLQRRVAHLADVLGPAVEARLLLRLWVDIEAELCGNHHLVPHRLQRFTDHFLIGEGAIDLGGVEEGNAALYCSADQPDTLVLTERSGIAEVQPHAAEADGRDFQITFSKFARFHFFDVVDVRLNDSGVAGVSRIARDRALAIVRSLSRSCGKS